MDIKSATIEQLKVKAYDQLVLLEQVQRNLQAINLEISERNKILAKNNEVS